MDSKVAKKHIVISLTVLSKRIKSRNQSGVTELLGPFCLPKRSMIVKSERNSFKECITFRTFVSETVIHPSLEK
jgi:hypothetical protein